MYGRTTFRIEYIPGIGPQSFFVLTFCRVTAKIADELLSCFDKLAPRVDVTSTSTASRWASLREIYCIDWIFTLFRQRVRKGLYDDAHW